MPLGFFLLWGLCYLRGGEGNHSPWWRGAGKTSELQLQLFLLNIHQHACEPGHHRPGFRFSACRFSALPRKLYRFSQHPCLFVVKKHFAPKPANETHFSKLYFFITAFNEVIFSWFAGLCRPVSSQAEMVLGDTSESRANVLLVRA